MKYNNMFQKSVCRFSTIGQDKRAVILQDINCHVRSTITTTLNNTTCNEIGDINLTSNNCE